MYPADNSPVDEKTISRALTNQKLFYISILSKIKSIISAEQAELVAEIIRKANSHEELDNIRVDIEGSSYKLNDALSLKKYFDEKKLMIAFVLGKFSSVIGEFQTKFLLAKLHKVSNFTELLRAINTIQDAFATVPNQNKSNQFQQKQLESHFKEIGLMLQSGNTSKEVATELIYPQSKSMISHQLFEYMIMLTQVLATHENIIPEEQLDYFYEAIIKLTTNEEALDLSSHLSELIAEQDINQLELAKLKFLVFLGQESKSAFLMKNSIEEISKTHSLSELEGLSSIRIEQMQSKLKNDLNHLSKQLETKYPAKILEHYSEQISQAQSASELYQIKKSMQSLLKKHELKEELDKVKSSFTEEEFENMSLILEKSDSVGSLENISNKINTAELKIKQHELTKNLLDYRHIANKKILQAFIKEIHATKNEAQLTQMQQKISPYISLCKIVNEITDETKTRHDGLFYLSSKKKYQNIINKFKLLTLTDAQELLQLDTKAINIKLQSKEPSPLHDFLKAISRNRSLIPSHKEATMFKEFKHKFTEAKKDATSDSELEHSGDKTQNTSF